MVVAPELQPEPALFALIMAKIYESPIFVFRPKVNNHSRLQEKLIVLFINIAYFF